MHILQIIISNKYWKCVRFTFCIADTDKKSYLIHDICNLFRDLYGAIGNPLRVARTVVVGRKADLVNKLLYVLSYFIRCSDVHEAPFTNCLSAILDSQCWELSVPPKSMYSEDGGVTPTESAAATIDSHPNVMEASDSTLCSSCGSCASALHFYSAQGKKTESPSPQKFVSSQLTGAYRDSEKTGHDPDRGPRCKSDRVGVTSEQTHEPSEVLPPVHCGFPETDGKVWSDDSGIENSDSYERHGSSKRNTQICKISAVHIVEDSRLENVRHVRRCAETGPTMPVLRDSGIVSAAGCETDCKQDQSSKRLVSVLSQQLAADNEASEKERQKAKIREIQKQFLSGGSNSMFEEYYEGDAETKTIDDLCEHHRIVKHPLAGQNTASPSPTLSSAHGGGDEVGTGVQTKVSVSRQNSMDTKPHLSRPTALNPARCR